MSVGMQLPDSWQGARVSVLGLARSGLALARVLGERGAQVLLSDTRPADQLASEIAQAQAVGAEVETGGHSERLLQADVLVMSPGVSLYAPVVQQAMSAGVAVAGEVEVAWSLCPRPILAVTGTNGKSTTCSLLQAALGERSRLAGNIGVPLVSEVSGDLAGVDFVVAEISSFQLETTHRFAPRLAMLTNVTPDHLDRHRTMQEYIMSKARLFAYQGLDDISICNADDEAARLVGAWVESGTLPSWPGFPPPTTEPRPVLWYSALGPVERGCWFSEGAFWLRLDEKPAQRLLTWNPANLPGPHNLSNALAACLAASCVGCAPADLEAALAGYGRMHHRMEEVGSCQGVLFVDDSKATNLSSVESALQSYADPVVLIAGGRDKGLDLAALGGMIAARCHALVAIGEAGPRILQEARDAGLSRAELAGDIHDAVRRAFALAPRPGVVLLSPACTSFDMFRNAEDRGDKFTQAARRLIDDQSEHVRPAGAVTMEER